MSHIGRNRSPASDEFFRGLLTLETVDECYQFFSDLLTVQELSAFSQRFQVARMLSQGDTYEKIRTQVSISSATITRINTELRYGGGGYRLVLDRLQALEGPEETGGE